MVVYSVGSYAVKVSKISDIGWSVTRYKNDERDLLEPGEYYTEDFEIEVREVARREGIDSGQAGLDSFE